MRLYICKIETPRETELYQSTFHMQVSEFSSFVFRLHLSIWLTGTQFPTSSGKLVVVVGRHQWSISSGLQFPPRDFFVKGEQASFPVTWSMRWFMNSLRASDEHEHEWSRGGRAAGGRGAARWAASSMGCGSIKWLSSADVCSGGITASHTDHTHLFSN